MLSPNHHQQKLTLLKPEEAVVIGEVGAEQPGLPIHHILSHLFDFVSSSVTTIASLDETPS